MWKLLKRLSCFGGNAENDWSYAAGVVTVTTALENMTARDRALIIEFVINNYRYEMEAKSDGEKVWVRPKD